MCRDGCRPLVPLGFESVTHIRVWKPRKKWIDRSGGVLLKYVSEVTFGGAGIAPSMLLEAVSEQRHSGDVSHRMNPRRDQEPQVLGLLLFCVFSDRDVNSCVACWTFYLLTPGRGMPGA